MKIDKFIVPFSDRSNKNVSTRELLFSESFGDAEFFHNLYDKVRRPSLMLAPECTLRLIWLGYVDY